MSANLCVCCGAIIPEGRQVCPICEKGLVSLKVAKIDKDELKFEQIYPPKTEGKTAPCVACRYAERIRRNKLKVFCQLRGVEVPILHSCEYGDRKTEKEIQRITNHYKTERKDKK